MSKNIKELKIIKDNLFEMILSPGTYNDWWKVSPEPGLLNVGLSRHKFNEMSNFDHNADVYVDHMFENNNLEIANLDIPNFLDVVSSDKTSYYKFVKICDKINDNFKIKNVHHIKIKNYVYDQKKILKSESIESLRQFKFDEKNPKIFKDEYNINEEYNHIFLVEFSKFNFIYSTFILTRTEFDNSFIKLKFHKTGKFLITDNFTDNSFKIASFSPSIKNILDMVRSTINHITTPKINYEICEGNYITSNIEEIL